MMQSNKKQGYDVKNENEMYTLAAIVAGFSAIIGLGRLLQSGETITLRLAIGRAITTSALGMAAWSVLALIPDMSNFAIIGLSFLAASIGESGVEKILNKYTQEK